ncbi:MAG: hypothetical protein ACREKS_11130 [Candidatus Rokuibacteriota bacterium]
MSESPHELTLDQVRDRMRAAGLQIPEVRLAMVRVLLNTALAPVRTMDAKGLKAQEPAVTFDAGADHGER